MAHVIDAQGKTVGRVATQAAHILMGKHKASFVKNRIVGDAVSITNASKVRISGVKGEKKNYVRYSGYPGGIKTESYNRLTARLGFGEAIKRAVYRMIPNNRLRGDRMKMLTIEE